MFGWTEDGEAADGEKEGGGGHSHGHGKKKHGHGHSHGEGKKSWFARKKEERKARLDRARSVTLLNPGLEDRTPCRSRRRHSMKTRAGASVQAKQEAKQAVARKAAEDKELVRCEGHLSLLVFDTWLGLLSAVAAFQADAEEGTMICDYEPHFDGAIPAKTGDVVVSSLSP